MNIPADLPSPDQENVYYSVESMKVEFSKYFTQSKINALIPKLREYYFPTFVFDDSNAPNSYQLQIYPKDGPTDSILLDGTGSIVLSKPKRVVPIQEPELLGDNASGVELDPSFYSESQLKHSDFFTSLGVDEQTTVGMDLLVSSRYWEEFDYISEREQYLEITKNIVTSTLQSLPKEELKALEEKFKTVGEEIAAIQDVLIRIADGQSDSFDSLLWSKAISANYKVTQKDLNEAGKLYTGLLGTKSNLAQSVIDLLVYRWNTSSPGMIRLSKVNLTGDENEVSVNDPKQPSNDNLQLSTVYGDFIDKLISPDTGGGRNTTTNMQPKLERTQLEGLLPDDFS